jgi:predicted dehydrogenase
MNQSTSRVNVAILGCGNMAGSHARRLSSRPDVRIIAVCDVSEALGQAFLGRHLPDYAPAPAVFTSASDMYQQAKPDAVVIVTPHTLHYQHALEALDAGCHVLMEKPMVTNAGDARKLSQKVKDAGRIFVVGYNTPCSPELAFIREKIREGSLGRLQLISGYLMQDWQRLTQGSWRQNPELSGGGQAYDSGAHMLNSVCWSVESNVREVFAFVDHNGSPVDINSVISIRFENGALASLAVGGNTPGNGSGLVYAFENGRIEFDPWNASYLRIWQGKDQVKYPMVPGNPTTPDDNFIDAILGKAQPRTSPENGIIQCELMDAIYESARTSKPAKPH